MLEILKFHFIVSLTIARHSKMKQEKLNRAKKKCVRLTIHLMGVTSFDTYQVVKCQHIPMVVKLPIKSQYHCESMVIDFSCGLKNTLL